MMSKVPVDKISICLLLALLGFVTADLGILSMRDKMFPTQGPPPSRPPNSRMRSGPDRLAYNQITAHNIFNADQKVPQPMGAGDKKGAPDAAPVPSTLPLQLVGTIVHINPARSVATINLKNKNDEYALKVDDIIPDNLGTITKIERNKVVFRNNASQRLEFIDIKDDAKINFGNAAPKVVQKGEVTQNGDNDFSIKRDDINRLTSNLPELLQQARAVPRLNAQGQVECFSLAEIQQGSIYERLGLKQGDCINSVNGEKIDSPAKAMELYNALRGNSNSISLGYERNGKIENNSYNITQ